MFFSAFYRYPLVSKLLCTGCYRFCWIRPSCHCHIGQQYLPSGIRPWTFLSGAHRISELFCANCIDLSSLIWKCSKYWFASKGFWCCLGFHLSNSLLPSEFYNYRIVASTNTCYYSENSDFLQSRIVPRRFFFRNKTFLFVVRITVVCILVRIQPF